MTSEENHSLLAHNTFAIDAHCTRFLEFQTADEVAQAAADGTLSELPPLLIIGAGANLLLTRDFDGTVAHSAIRGISFTPDGDHTLVRAGSGEDWDTFVQTCTDHHCHGLENLSLIPGEVGASAVQNIGAYGVEAKDFIHEIEAVRIADAENVKISPSECNYAYRHSRFKDEWRGRFFITAVTYRLPNNFAPRLDYGNIRAKLAEQHIDHPDATQLRQAIIDIRREKLPDPKVEGNAGSFFTNPIVARETFDRLRDQHPDMPHYDIDDRRVKIPAGWLIDQCGWKGRTVGRAGVHAKQALVIVNRGGATGQEIVQLSQTIQQDVFDRFGITITPEVNII